jgi:hypothetical protein
MNRSVFHIPGMDCPSEERMIRLALEGKVQAQLAFDLPGRRMIVLHNEPAKHLLDLLVPLGVGVRLVETREFGADRESRRGRRFGSLGIGHVVVGARH